MTARLVLALALAALALPLQAQQPQQPPAAAGRPDARAVAVERVARNYHRRIAVAMAEGGQPRDLALAAILHDLAAAGEEGSGEGPAAAWRQRAVEGAAGDVLANVLLASRPEEAGGAAPGDRAARRWAQLEPDNIAPLLFLDGGVGALLAGAAELRRFDLHMYAQVRWMQSMLLQHPPTANERAVLSADMDAPAEEDAAISAMGLWAAVAIPSLQALVDACEGRALGATATRAADCARIARTLVGHSDSHLGRMVGIDMLARMAGNASERAEAAELRRRMDWQMLEWGRVSAAQARDGAPQFARLLRDPQVRTEQDLVERILAEAGVPPDPPAGWQAPRR